MWQIFQFSLCPFSRKVRLVLAEKGVAYELEPERPWEGRDEMFAMNPAGRTPVLRHRDKGTVLVDSRAICEFFEETVDRAPMLPGNAAARAEIRRLTALVDENLFADVTGPLLQERMKKRLILRAPPDSGAIRKAMRLAHEHLDYLDYLLGHRSWLGGGQLSLADFAAAAQISVADYLGGIDWSGHDETRDWYRVMKSRPSFRPLLSERMEVIQPPAHYADVNA
jgi:glutathione S-transferase